MYGFGRFLQLMGLILVPVAVAGNMAEVANAEFHLPLRDSLILSAIGVALFFVGHLIVERAKP
jgi:hypothetical protein